MFPSLRISTSAALTKSTVNIKVIRGLLQCYSMVKNTFENFYLTIFMAINTQTMKNL